MYNVSQNYINKIMSHGVVTTWFGTVVTKSGKTYNLTDRNIKQSSSKIVSEGVSGESIQLGTTNSRQLTLQLYLSKIGSKYYINSMEVDRYDFFEAEVKLTFRLYLNKQLTSYEDVVMPTFTVQEAKRSSDLLILTCFDYMQKFNIGVTVADNGTAYDMASVACSACGITLGMTRSQMNALTNGQAIIFPYEAGTYVKTGLALISQVATFICACAYIGDDDKLYFKQYGMDTNRTISSDWRYSSQFADFETHYAFLTANDLTTNRTINVSVQVDTGLTYELGTNTFLQYGSDTDRRSRLQNILNKLNEVTYTPFTVVTPADPALEVFDILEFTDNQAVSGKKCCITSIEFNLNGKMTIKGVGEDPALQNIETASDFAMRELTNKVDSKTIYFYNFTNASQIEIADGDEKEICNIRFITTSATSLVFQLEALIDAETTVIGKNYHALNAKATYYLNEFEIENYEPTQVWYDGDHILHLFFPMEIQSQSANHLVITLHCEGGSVIIKPRRIKSSVYGQNLVATDIWNGMIDVRQQAGISDLVEPETITGIGIGQEIVATVLDTPESKTVTQMTGLTTLIMPPSITVKHPTETIGITMEEVNND